MKPAQPPKSLGRFKRDALMLSMDDQPHGGESDADGGGITIVNPKMVVVMVKGPGGEAIPPGTHLMDDDEMKPDEDEDEDEDEAPAARPKKTATTYGR
jgi:hypothetical protein